MGVYVCTRSLHVSQLWKTEYPDALMNARQHSLRRVFNRAHIRRLLRICVFHLRMKRSIYKYYPLRLRLYAILRWFKFVEGQYLHTTPGLKGAVRRRQDLNFKLGAALQEFSRDFVFARVPDKVEYTRFASCRAPTHTLLVRACVRV